MLKKIFLTSCAFISLTLTTFAAEKVIIDPSASKIVYLAKKVTGSHTGEVKFASGYLTFSKDVLTGGEFVADMTSIANSDIADQEYHKKFITHMLSDDFFNVEKYKTAIVTISNVKQDKIAEHYKIKGFLAIKGIKKPISFDAIVNKEKASASLTFDRTLYKIKYGSGKFFPNLGDKLIYDQVQLDITLAAKK